MSERNDPSADPDGTGAASTGDTNAAGTNAGTNAGATKPSQQEHHNPETDEDTASGGSADA
jgi:hypothetical protein